MNKQEIEQELRERRENLEAETAKIAELEAKLREPEKWEPMGGEWRVFLGSEGLGYCRDHNSLRSELPYRVQTKEAVIRFVDHIENQIELWQLAESLNDGWVPDWEDADKNKWVVFFCRHTKKWCLDYWRASDFIIPCFRDRKTGEKALEILNNQGVIKV